MLEIGTGTGAQFRWYAPGVDRHRAWSPTPPCGSGRGGGRRGPPRASTVVDGRAEELPFADASFDAAVSAFALCTVADPAAALAELRRVLVPGGTLLLLEHVHLPWEPGRTLQSRAAPAWAAVAGGCRLDRDTVRTAVEAGFDVVAALARGRLDRGGAPQRTLIRR